MNIERWIFREVPIPTWGLNLAVNIDFLPSEVSQPVMQPESHIASSTEAERAAKQWFMANRLRPSKRDRFPQLCSADHRALDRELTSREIGIKY